MGVVQMVCSLASSLILGMLILPVLAKTKTTQTILHYVSEHSEKNGTPTMGGLIFIIAICLMSLIFIKEKILVFCIVISLASGFVGLLDDVAKVRFGKNMGLMPYQKIVSQMVLSALFAYYIWWNIGSQISIPFSSVQLDIGIFIFPLLIIAFIATTNTVNLTDGLDGLCTSSVIVSVSLLWVLVHFQMLGKYSVMSYSQAEDFSTLAAVVVFSLFGFLVFNANKASVFMGDVGSLFLGGMVVSLFAISKNLIYLLIFGLPFVVSGLSDILQVGYFKITRGKRIFLMAPYHHHLQRKGLSENKICVLYAAATLLFGLAAICFV